MNRITPHLWYDTQAREAAELYTSVIPDSRILNKGSLDGTPSGSVEMVSIELSGLRFDLLSAGPGFFFNPSISFLVGCRSKSEVDSLWSVLSQGGSSLMELGAYPFSEWYGWVQDRYGLSWQIMHAGSREIRQRITPTLMFVGEVCGKAEEAVRFYTSLFEGSRVGEIMRYREGEAPDRPGTVKHAAFTLEGQDFAAMDSAHDHPFGFNEAISFIVRCDSQEQIDYFWSRLSAEPAAEQCGWLKDRYGVSWQVIPTVMERMMRSGDKKQIARVTEAFLAMKKFDIETLERAYKG
jgi:predicted 3-demethylubiquinone-9 3-methyltransferase (glyoxalase superfamily)